MKKDTKVAKVAKIHIREERNHGRRTVARQEAAGKEEAREKTGHVGLVVKTGHTAAWCRKGGNNTL